MSLEYKRKQLELARVQMAHSELEFKVEEKTLEIEKLKEYVSLKLTEKTQEIEKIKEHIAIQEAKEAELITELEKFQQ